jgi:hypothetical protein
MTMLMLESFEHVTGAAHLLAKGWAEGVVSAISAAQARSGTKSAEMSVTSTGWLAFQCDNADKHATMICGFGLYVDDTPTAFRLSFMGDNNVTTHVQIQLSATGQIIAFRSTNVELGRSDPNTIIDDGWYYVEVKVVLSDAAGAVVVKVNGATVLNLTGIDTKNAGTAATLDTVKWGASSASPNIYVDDIYIANGAGAVNNDFVGECRIRAIKPNGNGNSSQFTGSDGNSVDNYLLVDETTPDTVDFVGSATLDHKDTYAFEDLPDVTGTVAAVQALAYAAKTDAGARNLAIVTRSGGADYDGADVALGTTPTYVKRMMETNPATGVAWLRAEVNAAEFGVKNR